jgi:hypothetical protein
MKHLERHPEPVEGCFGCKVLTQIITVPRRMSWRNEDMQAEHMAGVRQRVAELKAEGKGREIQPVGSRWV